VIVVIKATVVIDNGVILELKIFAIILVNSCANPLTWVTTEMPD